MYYIGGLITINAADPYYVCGFITFAGIITLVGVTDLIITGQFGGSNAEGDRGRRSYELGFR